MFRAYQIIQLLSQSFPLAHSSKLSFHSFIFIEKLLSNCKKPVFLGIIMYKMENSLNDY
jgi:hypothetical protein